MPAAAVVTLVLTALTVLVLAFYLVRVALALRHVTRSLGALVGGLEAIGRQTHPLGDLIGDVNREVAAIQQALHGVVGDVEPEEPGDLFGAVNR